MKKPRKTSGQSLVEFALIFPILFFMITGFIDLGRAVFYFSSLSNSVREGTRYAIVHKDAVDTVAKNNGYPDLIQKVKEFSFGIKTSDITVVPEVLLDESDKPESIKITATYMFLPITPGIKQIFGSMTGLPISAQSTMRLAAIAR